MNPNDDVAELLETAASILDTYGWCQGAFVSDYGRRCLIGAIDKAAVDMTFTSTGLQPDAAYRTAAHREALQRIHKKVDMNIPIWNDAEGRTHGEVTDLLRETAKDLRNQ